MSLAGKIVSIDTIDSPLLTTNGKEEKNGEKEWNIANFDIIHAK
jgi:hypothetical protein